MKIPIITLLTDFGMEDTFAGVMKGVILGITPHARVVDLTHAVPPQDIRAAAFHIAGAVKYFPPGTIHTVVVDPGVGSERAAIAVQTESGFYVAPNNGVLSLSLKADPPKVAVRLSNSEYWLPTVSKSFHGRDIFAPASAHLARGVPIENLGPAIDDLVSVPFSQAVQGSFGSIEGRVQHIDHFGNCITNIPAEMLSTIPSVVIKVGGCRITGIVPSYSAVEPGEILALIGSTGYVEIAQRDGHAARKFDIRRDTPVSCRMDH